MKKLLLATTALAVMTASTAMAGSGDSGVPLVDGVTNGLDAQASVLDESPDVLVPVVLLMMPFFVAGGVVVDTVEKLGGN